MIITKIPALAHIPHPHLLLIEPSIVAAAVFEQLLLRTFISASTASLTRPGDDVIGLVRLSSAPGVKKQKI